MSRLGRLRQASSRDPVVQWAGAILLNRRGEFLLNLRDSSKLLYPDMWDVIGGTLEHGEEPRACILREILEETGETLDEVEHLQSFDVPSGDGETARFHLFRGEINREVSELLLGEGQEHRFYAPGDLASLNIAPGTREVLVEFAATMLKESPAPTASGPARP